ncbi:MerR family DNA-binding protein [Agromyces sp. Soil535]|uniref:MerR family DNA-binding protein n=1 Tax=Agromyces sp. Soil535 TaxID=1736390 RepID=UPI000AA0037C|nr:MerR family DNA-binding protein [Agromyces sp. Soil535]
MLLLRVIKAAQGLGFTLDEVTELVDAGSHAHRRRTHLADHARAKLVQVRAKIAALQQIEATLEETIEAGCDDLTVCALKENCPIPFQTITLADDV